VLRSDLGVYDARHRDKKVVGVFIAFFSCAASMTNNVFEAAVQDENPNKGNHNQR
jgi:hypothetical protein